MAEKRDDQATGQHSGALSGLRWEAEECPDATSSDIFRSTAGGGAIGFVSGLLLGMSPAMRIVAALAGAAVGHVSSKYHLNLDWDPDQLRGGGDDEPPKHGPDEAPTPDVQPF
jgi:hypothetical protein